MGDILPESGRFQKGIGRDGAPGGNRASDLQRRGVHGVLTAAATPDAAIIPNRARAPPGTERYLQPAIARGVVQYVGEPVALLGAHDTATARREWSDHLLSGAVR